MAGRRKRKGKSDGHEAPFVVELRDLHQRVGDSIKEIEAIRRRGDIWFGRLYDTRDTRERIRYFATAFPMIERLQPGARRDEHHARALQLMAECIVASPRNEGAN